MTSTTTKLAETTPNTKRGDNGSKGPDTFKLSSDDFHAKPKEFSTAEIEAMQQALAETTDGDDIFARVNESLTKLRAEYRDSSALSLCVERYVRQQLEDTPVTSQKKDQWDIEAISETLRNSKIFDIEYFDTERTMTRNGVDELIAAGITEGLRNQEHLAMAEETA